MRKFFASALLSAVMATAAQAATMEVRLVATEVTPGSGLYNVAVQASTDTAQPSVSAGGISGFQFDIVSEGTGLSAPVPAGVGPLAGRTKITWDPMVASKFSLINPSRVDTNPAWDPGNPDYVPDGDLDAPGASFSDPNNFSKIDLGVSGFVTLATEQWQLTSPNVADALSVYVIGAEFYDFVNGSAPAFRGAYDTVLTSGTVLGVPEPSTFALGGLGLVGAALSARRRGRQG